VGVIHGMTFVAPLAGLTALAYVTLALLAGLMWLAYAIVKVSDLAKRKAVRAEEAEPR
jgi:hypothetical protein